MRALKLALATGLSAVLIGGLVSPAKADNLQSPHAATLAAYQAKLDAYNAAKVASAASPADLTLKKSEKRARVAAIQSYKAAKKNIGKTFKASVATAKRTFKTSAKRVADRSTRDAAIAKAAADRDAALLQLGSPPQK